LGVWELVDAHVTWVVAIRDASVIYGSTQEGQNRVRAFQDGKLKIRLDGWLDSDKNNLPVSGDIRNLWVGVAALQSLFIAEHNAICDTLKVSVELSCHLEFGSAMNLR
jgi:alpha-dioxygenase